jgi:hypothetical protein
MRSIVPIITKCMAFWWKTMEQNDRINTNQIDFDDKKKIPSEWRDWNQCKPKEHHTSFLHFYNAVICCGGWFRAPGFRPQLGRRKKLGGAFDWVSEYVDKHLIFLRQAGRCDKMKSSRLAGREELERDSAIDTARHVQKKCAGTFGASERAIWVSWLQEKGDWTRFRNGLLFSLCMLPCTG